MGEILKCFPFELVKTHTDIRYGQTFYLTTDDIVVKREQFALPNDVNDIYFFQHEYRFNRKYVRHLYIDNLDGSITYDQKYNGDYFSIIDYINRFEVDNPFENYVAEETVIFTGTLSKNIIIWQKNIGKVYGWGENFSSQLGLPRDHGLYIEYFTLLATNVDEFHYEDKGYNNQYQNIYSWYSETVNGEKKFWMSGLKSFISEFDTIHPWGWVEFTDKVTGLDYNDNPIVGTYDHMQIEFFSGGIITYIVNNKPVFYAFGYNRDYCFGIGKDYRLTYLDRPYRIQPSYWQRVVETEKPYIDNTAIGKVLLNTGLDNEIVKYRLWNDTTGIPGESRVRYQEYNGTESYVFIDDLEINTGFATKCELKTENILEFYRFARAKPAGEANNDPNIDSNVTYLILYSIDDDFSGEDYKYLIMLVSVPVQDAQNDSVYLNDSNYDNTDYRRYLQFKHKPAIFNIKIDNKPLARRNEKLPFYSSNVINEGIVIWSTDTCTNFTANDTDDLKQVILLPLYTPGAYIENCFAYKNWLTIGPTRLYYLSLYEDTNDVENSVYGDIKSIVRWSAGDQVIIPSYLYIDPTGPAMFMIKNNVLYASGNNINNQITAEPMGNYVDISYGNDTLLKAEENVYSFPTIFFRLLTMLLPLGVDSADYGTNYIPKRVQEKFTRDPYKDGTNIVDIDTEKKVYDTIGILGHTE
jgi:hypothetical protein